jgi:hypothetical protein
MLYIIWRASGELYKVVAMMVNNLINDAKSYSQSRVVAEAVTIIPKAEMDMRRIRELNKKIAQTPVVIHNAQRIRETNRQK